MKGTKKTRAKKSGIGFWKARGREKKITGLDQ
jgi:hypothetical protein